MKVALRVGVGVIAVLCAMLALPSVVGGAVLSLPAWISLPNMMPEYSPAIWAAIGWLTVVLYVGLALMVEPTVAKVAFVLAATVHALTMASDFLNLVELLVIAKYSQTLTNPIQLPSLGWLWTLSSLLFTAGIALGFRRYRWLVWLSIGALALELAQSVGVLSGLELRSVRELVDVAVLMGIAYVLLIKQGELLVTVEQAHRADAVS